MRTELKVLRIKKQLTQTQLASKLGTTVANYCLIEKGTRNGSKDFWNKIQKFYILKDGEVCKLYNNK